MKTSFYFFLWIIIYPLLGLLNTPIINQNSFIAALFVVWGLSWFLNKNMPDTLRYERLSEIASVLEEVYTENIRAFQKRLSRMVTLEFITAVYLGVAFIFVLFSMVRGSGNDWVALLIFGFFSFAAISRAFKLSQSYNKIKENPTAEECVTVMEQTYNINYSSYYNARSQTTAAAMIPPEPKHFMAFQIFSLVIAIITALLGLYFLVLGIIILIHGNGAESISGGIMYFLYGSLAAYFGIRDSLSCITYFRLHSKKS